MEFEDNTLLGALKYFSTPNLYINLKIIEEKLGGAEAHKHTKCSLPSQEKKIKDFIYPPFTVRPSIVFFANTPNSSAFPVAGFCKARVMRNVKIHSTILICKVRGLS